VRLRPHSVKTRFGIVRALRGVLPAASAAYGVKPWAAHRRAPFPDRREKKGGGEEGKHQRASTHSVGIITYDVEFWQARYLRLLLNNL
jgi:hypothetical protein